MAPKRGRSGRRSAAGASTPLPPPSSDVVFEILSWLPLRSLSRSRCVCKSWRALISNPAFVAAHRSRVQPLLVATTDPADSNTSTTSTLQIMDTEGDVVRLVDLGDYWNFRVSLGGLVLVDSGGEYHSDDVRVVDLATRETIASCPRPVVDEGVSRVTARFGFGRAARSGALKVVRIISYFLFPRCRLTCQVFDVGDDGGSGRWRRTRSPHDFFCDGNDGVTVDGVLHFRSLRQDDILRFDLESEEWTTIDGPVGTLSPWDKISLAEINGVLCVAHTKQYTVNIWLLTDLDKNVWVKEYTISVDHAANFVPVRALRPGGKLLFYYRHGYKRTTVLQEYDPCTGKCTNVQKGMVGTIGLCSSRLDSRLCGQP
uniref:Uncharacterized protein n=1 Tax=Avena sativa TaxID=4498 RepID=A0ACD5XDI7_AVESA